MRAWLLLGSLAAGLCYYVYQYISEREQQHQYGPSGTRFSEEDFIEINGTTPKEVASNSNRKKKLPGKDDQCSICLEYLLRFGDPVVERKYCIIALPTCGHWLHQKCALRLLEYHPQCPICRVPIDMDDLRSTPVRLLQSLENNATEGDSPHDPTNSEIASTSSSSVTRRPTAKNLN